MRQSTSTPPFAAGVSRIGISLSWRCYACRLRRHTYLLAPVLSNVDLTLPEGWSMDDLASRTYCSDCAARALPQTEAA